MAMTFRHHWRKYTLKSSNLSVYLYILISLTVYFNIFNQLSGLLVETGLFLLILSALSKVLCLSYLLNFIIDFNLVMPLHVSTTSSLRNRMMQTKRNPFGLLFVSNSGETRLPYYFANEICRKIINIYWPMCRKNIRPKKEATLHIAL